MSVQMTLSNPIKGKLVHEVSVPTYRVAAFPSAAVDLNMHCNDKRSKALSQILLEQPGHIRYPTTWVRVQMIV